MEIYKNKNYPVEERIKDLISKMTLNEKVRQIDHYSASDMTETVPGTYTCVVNEKKMEESIGTEPMGIVQNFWSNAKVYNKIQRYAIEKTRLGIPILFCQEALHGFGKTGATVFPQQIALGSTFNPELGEKMGAAIALEARTCGIQETWNPVCDLAREPRWGRTEENFGEDTYHSSRFAYSIVKGLQGDDISRKDKVSAELKHYTAYGIPMGGHNCAPAAIGRHEMFEYCQPVFEAAVKDAGAYSVMASYSSVDGSPVPSDKELMTDVLRGEWGMRGYSRSDMCAISMLNHDHNVADTREEAIRMALEAGTDVQLYDFPHDFYQNAIKDHINSGRMSMETLDTAVSRVLRVKFDLGLFDDPYIDEEYEFKVFHCEEHRKLAYEIASQSITLLKNKNNILPLSKNLKKIAVIGPTADETCVGDYTNFNKDVYEKITLLTEIRKTVSPETEVVYAKGCDYLPAKLKKFGIDCYSHDGVKGVRGEYYNNDDLEGAPVLVRDDGEIGFSFIAAKAADCVDARFSARWTSDFNPGIDGAGFIGTNCEDSIRVWLDDELIIDAWDDRKGSTNIPFTFENKNYKLKIEYRCDERGASVILGYIPKDSDISEAVEAAKGADVAIVSVGDCAATSGENLDRCDLNLPGQQLDLVKAVYETGTPVILVLQSGRPMTITWEDKHLPAIVQAFFAGELGGKAIADVIFGDINPSGRLPISFPKHVGQLPVFYSRKPAGGTRYVDTLDNRNYDNKALYTFGYGLSYTTFEYSDMKLSANEIFPDGTVDVTFKVTNIGDREGVAVAQVYVRDCFASVVKPSIELKGFERVSLRPGESKEVKVTLGTLAFRTLNPKYQWVVEPGKMIIFAGPNSEELPLEAELQIIAKK